MGTGIAAARALTDQTVRLHQSPGRGEKRTSVKNPLAQRVYHGDMPDVDCRKR